MFVNMKNITSEAAAYIEALEEKSDCDKLGGIYK